MAITNYASDKPLEKIFSELQQTLATYGAKQISYEYGDDGAEKALAYPPAILIRSPHTRAMLQETCSRYPC